MAEGTIRFGERSQNTVPPCFDRKFLGIFNQIERRLGRL
jgi:hypothetical protein